MWFLKGNLCNRFDNVQRDDGLFLDVLGCNWAVLSCNKLYRAVLTGLYLTTGLYLALVGCSGLYLAVLGCTGLY